MEVQKASVQYRKKRAIFYSADEKIRVFLACFMDDISDTTHPILVLKGDLCLPLSPSPN